MRGAVPMLVCLLVASQARANPMDVFGFGARSSSLGGAVTADVEDFSANYYNPAGLVRGDQLRLSVGYFGAAMGGMEVNGRSSGLEGVRGLTFGIVAPARIGNVDVAFGLGGHLNDHMLSRTLGRPPDELRWILYDNRPHRIFLSTHLAIRPVRWLLIGGGMAFQSRSSATLDIRGNIAVDAGSLLGGEPTADAEADSRLEHQLDAELTTIRYPQVGIQIVPNDKLSFGAVYRGEFDLRVRLEAYVDDTTLDAVLIPGSEPLSIPAFFRLVTDSINAFQPQQLSMGMAYRPLDRLRVGLEVTWENWSAYQSPVGLTEVELDIDAPPVVPLDIPDEIEGSQPIPAGFRDRWVPRLGVEYGAVRTTDVDLDVRAGYVYERSPMPAQTGVTNFVDGDRHVASLGAGLTLRGLEPTLPGWLRFDVFFQYSHLTRRRTVKGSLVSPTADYVSRGRIFTAGANVEVAFE